MNFDRLFMEGKKSLLLIISSLSIVIFHIGIFFIDNRWWWALFVVIPLCITTLSLYNEEIKESPTLKFRLSYLLGWITFYTLIFVLISAIFITPLWWIGLLLVIIMLGALGSFEIEPDGNKLLYNEKKRIAIITLILFLTTFLLFCVPSFISNANKNPKDSFSSSWSAVESYSIYGVGNRDKNT